VAGELLVSIANVTIDDTWRKKSRHGARGSYVRLSVSDNGEGMTPEAQNARSNRSLPQAQHWQPALGWQWCTALSNNPAATSRCIAELV
jgi:hypothetical protein